MRCTRATVPKQTIVQGETGLTPVHRFSFKGIEITAIDLHRALDIVGKLATSAKGIHVTSTGAHGIVEAACDARIRAAHNAAEMVVADGMPIVWLDATSASASGG